jgi:hypothetical protein
MIRPRLRLLGSWVFLVSWADPGAADNPCAPVPPPSGSTVVVSTVPQLEAAVDGAAAGTTILVADGVYHLVDALIFRVPSVTLRSQSGNRDAVVLDGDYAVSEIVLIAASNVTVADLTLREAFFHPIHVTSTASSDVENALIYNVHVVDPGEQAIKINPVDASHFTDHGTVACSHIELTDAGRAQVGGPGGCYTGGVDAHASLGWTIRDNVIEGFWCESGLSEHAVHFWRNSRDTLVERNVLRDNARGVGFGLSADGPFQRTYPDDPCPSAAGGYVGHYGGSVRNNFVSASRPELLSSADGFDCGICLWQACGSEALHNTVFTADPSSTFSSIEWRFARTAVDITNNLVNHTMRERDGATATQAGNVTGAQASWFADATSGDLHLLATASGAVDRGVPSALGDDIDGDPRPLGVAPDVGADELAPPADFFTVAPCRLVDTRDPALGGPDPLHAETDRRFVLTGRCGVPATARAVSVNVAVTQPTARGHLRIYPDGAALPPTSTVNYGAAQTRANNAIVTPASTGAIQVRCNQPSGTVHLIIDVNGYLQ